MIRLDTVLLPDGLVWSDEFAAQTVAQTVRRALDGSLVVFYGQHSGGLTITLESEPDAGWLTRAQVEALKLRADSPGGIFTLELRGQVFQVMFRHHEPPAFEAKPLVALAHPQPGDFYLATLKLMTV
jgi:hypothetical protein